MALIKCPECGTEVSEKAEKCPKCAYPLNPKNSITQLKNDSKPEVIVKPKEGCFLQTLNVGCMIIAIIIGIAILAVIFN